MRLAADNSLSCISWRRGETSLALRKGQGYTERQISSLHFLHPRFEDCSGCHYLTEDPQSLLILAHKRSMKIK
ncbi:hypothetical protein MHYP_G00021690 [Metynnis hypsauchen]